MTSSLHTPSRTTHAGTRAEFLARCHDALHDATDRYAALLNQEHARRARNHDTAAEPEVISRRERALVSARIFALYRLHNLDHVEIGSLLGCPANLIYEWEAGTAIPSALQACQLAALEEVVANEYRIDLGARVDAATPEEGAAA
jgi:hypothetical protein